MPSRTSHSMTPKANRNSKSRLSLSRLLGGLFSPGSDSPAEPKRGRLLLESLEKRQLMAGDMELLFTDGTSSSSEVASQTSGLQLEGVGEGEAAPDLVQFAKDLAAKGVEFYGAHWCPACTAQKELFADGKDDLPFTEVTDANRQFLPIAGPTQLNIVEIPTWDFPNGTRLTGVQSLAALSAAAEVPIPTSDQPTIQTIGDLTVRSGAPLHVPVDAYDPGNGPLTTTVTVEDPTLLTATVLTGNRSIRIDMATYGDMVFELFEQRAPRPAGRVIELAEDGFYDGQIFHRVVDGFVLQTGSPDGSGSLGSTLGTFSDQFHPDLQHIGEGVLSFAKTSLDDTNNSQFFITETDTRHLDFNHSVFGQLVEGFDVREAISSTAVNNTTENRPVTDVVIESVTVFDDTENSVVMLKGVGNKTGTTNVTFTVTDSNGNSFSETVAVTVVADTGTNSNGQPYLLDIPTPTPVSGNQPATLTLSSVDVEGDPVQYFASTTSNNATVNVNPTTGQLTVTPVSGFEGNVSVTVGVRASASSPVDTEVIQFTFEGEGAITPTSIDLQAGSDTGISNTDNITNAGTLSFLVSGTVAGQQIELVNTANNVVLGTVVASGTTAVVTTNNFAALGTGTYNVAARSKVGTDSSSLSPAITINYDRTLPSSVVASALKTANVGRPYISDLVSTEEGTGLVYEITSGPTGATINASTGVINWSPVESQLGSQSFAIKLTDAAGNVRSESFNVAVAGEPLVEILLGVTDTQGNAITSLDVGQKFLLTFTAADARLFNKPGVFAAYADILFDSTLVRRVAGTPIQYADDFTLTRKGTFGTGIIDELGAVSSQLQATNEAQSLIATIEMEAIASGSVTIRSAPATDSNSETLIFGVDERIDAEDSISYGSVSLAIGQNFIVRPDTFTVAEDSATTSFDVLANDEVTGTGSLSIVSVTQPASGGTVALSGGSVNFTPAANFVGNAVFTYRVSNSTGIQQDASVTVTVTGVNDPPTGVADSVTVDQNSTNNTLDVLANDSSAPDTGETLTITAVSTPNNGGTVTINSTNNALVYTPAAGYVGGDSFTYTLSDGTLTTTVSVNVTVITADDPPTAVNDSFSITEDAASTTYDVRANDTRDADNQAFVVNSVGTPSQGGTASVSADGNTIRYAPAANFNGVETVTYTIRDTGGGIAVGTATFTVAAVNDPPPASNLTQTLNRGAGETVVFQLDNAINVDSGETLSVSTFDASTTAGGSVRLDSATGRLFYTPPSATFSGSDSFTYTVADSTGMTATGTISITVLDYVARDIVYSITGSSALRLGSSNIMLRGNNILGEEVNVAGTASSTGVSFPGVLPGEYTIEVPAIPFLVGGEQAQSIPVSSDADDGNATIQSTLGTLRPEYISIRDFLRSTPRQSLLVAVAPGQSSLMTTTTPSTDTIENATAQLDASGQNLTIRGTLTDATTSEVENIEVTLPASNDRRVEARGEVDGLRLYKVSVEESEVEFTTTSTTTTTAAASLLTQTASESAEIAANSAASTNSLTLGSTVPEAESAAVSSTSAENVYAPAPEGSSSSALVLSTGEADVWTDTPADLVDSPATASFENTANNDVSVDAAMQSVSEQLTLQSRTADSLSESKTLSEEGIDTVLGELA
ncbi:Ig-like domain-containing protein [Rubripirellula amarantea]|nr:tandem-95 repeat protein [Rubripirellula amarantea]